ncbi:MAG TPA: glycosyltransferase family 2 protein, partial [Steroidobacteraceae bacterium]
MKVSIIIAIYNEAGTAGALLERVWAQPLPGLTRELIIVESNSTDGSRAIVADFVARRADSVHGEVHVIYQDRPHGKGHAVRAGFAAASGDILLIQDADLEYEVSDYPDLLRPIVEGHTALVLGSRHLRPASWKIRQFANHGLLAGFMNAGGVVFRVLFNLLFSVRLTDPTTMYKVFRASCLEGISFTCNGFDFDFELLGKLIRAGYVPLEVPISYKSRGFDEGKKIRILRDPVAWLLAILRCRFSSTGRARRRLHEAAASRRSPSGVTVEA